MTSFVRFIFAVLIAGILLNLAIVGLANVNSERRRTAELKAEREAFSGLLARLDGRLRRADIGVEWQTLDAGDRVVESSLLVRQYYLTGADDLRPLPIVRVKVPGSRILVDGVLLEFDSLFTSNNANLELFRGKRLAYFNHIYVEDQRPSDQFAFLTELEVPPLTRLHPAFAFAPDDLLARIDREAAAGIERARAEGRDESFLKKLEEKRDDLKARVQFDVRTPEEPSLFELQVWQRLWDGIKDPARRPTGFTVTHLPAAAREVRRGQVYAAFVGPDGVTVEPQTSTGLFAAMRDEADKYLK
jgi:hypothetical protein